MKPDYNINWYKICHSSIISQLLLTRILQSKLATTCNKKMPKIMLNYKTNGWRWLGRPLKRLSPKMPKQVYQDLICDGKLISTW